MRFEDQGAHGPALVRDLFFFGQEDGRFLGATERRIMGVGGGLVHVVGRQGGGKIQSGGHHGVLGGEPALRSQEGVGFLGVVIEDGFQIRFVGITVVLRADEGAVQVRVSCLMRVWAKLLAGYNTSPASTSVPFCFLRRSFMVK